MQKMDDLATQYLRVRGAKEKHAQVLKEQQAVFQAELDRLSGLMLQSLQDAGVTSTNTGVGTIARVMLTRPEVTDWDAYYAFLYEHKAFDGLEKRASKSFVDSYMAANGGAVPTGVKLNSEFSVRVTKPRAKAGKET
jgi:hypothetical protein